MKVTEVNQNLVGKKVSCVFTGLKTTGVVVAVIEDEYSKGVRIKFDKPVQWGDEFYKEFESTARKFDSWGNLMPIALKRYHCSVLSGTIVALRAVPLISL